MTLRRCIHQGGSECKRQGGDGSLYHTCDYVHPYPCDDEVDSPLSTTTELVKKSAEPVYFSEFEEFFNEEVARVALCTDISQPIDVMSIVKSLYKFDLNTVEGVTKILEVLPVLDSEVVVQLATEIWPGYATEEPDVDLFRYEIRGFLANWLRESKGYASTYE